MPETLPNGQVGHPYFLQLKVDFTGSGCSNPLFVEMGPGQGGLPAGMKLSKDGALDGTPLASGTYRFEVTASYDKSSSIYDFGFATRLYDLIILPA